MLGQLGAGVAITAHEVAHTRWVDVLHLPDHPY
jgi:hypothetical protein